MQCNFDSFLINLKRLNIHFDVLILTECWITENSIIQNLEGYKSYQTEKFINRAGGVVAYVKTELSPIVHEPVLVDANCLYIDIPNRLSILGIYRSPSVSNEIPFLSSLESLLDINKHKADFIVTGDINRNILNNSGSNEYLCLMAEFSLISAVDKPTRQKACLDHIFARTRNKIVTAVCQTSITDHSMVLAGLSNKFLKCPHTNRFRLKVNYDDIVTDLENIDWSDLLNETDPHKAANILDDTLNTVIKNHSDKVLTSRSRTNLKPWMTPGLIRCSKHKDNLHAKARKNPNDPLLHKIFTRYRNFYRDLIRKLKTKYEKEELEKNKNNPKLLWQAIRQITHTNSSKSSATNLILNNSDSQNCLDSFNKYFSTVGQNLAKQILNNINQTEEALAAKVINSDSPSNSFYLEPTDPYEVDAMIANSRIDSAPGLDGVSNRLLKTIKPFIVEPLTHVFNLSLSEGKFLNNWKTASITPVHKGGDKESPCNYRPISLLGAFSKILERIVNKRLTHFLEANELLSERQFGFRRGKCTEQAVCLLTNIIADKLDKGNACIGVF
ncbi:hypothetical protein ABMA28_002163 [Loxostege sticticalis]|uniref:Reverse transcriptase domain-containing protein n=1 Tax=Loxostege sticticalis TaxID=481309 RepID=A0ABD0SZZ7_LOXSC